MLKQPRFVGGRPVRVSLDDRHCIFVVRFVICAKIEPGALPCALSDGVEEIRLHDPMFVVPRFWPRIRKENKDARKHGAGWQRFQEQPGIGLDKMKVSEFRALTFAVCPPDSLGDKVDSDAKVGGMRMRVGGEKMSMSAADFPYELGIDRNYLRERVAKFAPASLHHGQIIRGANGVIHGVSCLLR